MISDQATPLQALQTPNIVTDSAPHKIMIEIPEGKMTHKSCAHFYSLGIAMFSFVFVLFCSFDAGGLVKVFTEHYSTPLFEAPNLNPIHVNYIAFAADDMNSAEYYFDCIDDDDDVDDESKVAAKSIPMVAKNDHGVLQYSNAHSLSWSHQLTVFMAIFTIAASFMLNNE